MSEEVFDVVNERDEVIGREVRSRVHALGLQHRAVHVLVFNKRGDLFLQKRSMLKDNFPGVWDTSSAGHLDSGEDYDACSIRELREELGWSIAEAPERLFKIAACEETGMEHVWVYRLEAEGPFELQASEIDRGEWFHPDVITGWIDRRPKDFAPGFRMIWGMLGTSGKHRTSNIQH